MEEKATKFIIKFNNDENDIACAVTCHIADTIKKLGMGAVRASDTDKHFVLSFESLKEGTKLSEATHKFTITKQEVTIYDIKTKETMKIEYFDTKFGDKLDNVIVNLLNKG